MADTHLHIDGTGITEAEHTTIGLWINGQILGNAAYTRNMVSYNPNTQVLQISLAGPDAQGQAATVFSRLPAAIRAKLSRVNRSKAESRIRTAEDQSCSRPGSGRRLCP